MSRVIPTKARELLRELRGDVARHRKLTNPAVWPLIVRRLGRANEQLPAPARAIGRRLYSLAAFGLDMTLGTVLHRETEIGDDLVLIHAGSIKIHTESVLGDRVVLNHEVTLGSHHHQVTGAPRIGNDVFIGAGAKILGPVTIGDGAVIAANSLVVTDIPPGVTAMGVPARAVPKQTREPAANKAPAVSHLRAVPAGRPGRRR